MRSEEERQRGGGEHRAASGGGPSVWSVIAPFGGSADQERTFVSVLVHNVKYHLKVCGVAIFSGCGVRCTTSGCRPG